METMSKQVQKIKIARVVPDSIAEELEIEEGDYLLSINGIFPKDVLEFYFQEKSEEVTLLIETNLGNLLEFEIEKELYEPIGIEFEEVLFDGLRQCKQNCLFCFVKQMPKGMRRTLYYRDDDYRLSFLNGNFITGSNLTPKDLERIALNHFSPLYYSLQAVSPEVRSFLLGDKNPLRIKEQFAFFEENGIELHLQVVLCPGINDGEELEKTLQFSFSYSNVLSVGLVPVGITKFLPSSSKKYIRRFSKEEMEKVFKIAKNYSNYPLYLSDEFYLFTGKEVPPEEYYDDYPQLENGIGMVRLFLEDWERVKGDFKIGEKYLIVTGELFGDFLKKLLPSQIFEILIVENNFFGKTVTVAGLLTGCDIKKSLEKINYKNYDKILLPANSINDEGKFLDDFKIDQLRKEVGKIQLVNYLSEAKED